MTRITLNRLERPEVETMVGHLAGGKPLPGEVVDHIVAKADGVPLYVEELTKAILGSGVLPGRAGSTRHSPKAKASPLLHSPSAKVLAGRTSPASSASAISRRISPRRSSMGGSRAAAGPGCRPIPRMEQAVAGTSSSVSPRRRKLMGGKNQFRTGLAAGGNRIRTIGPASGKVVDAKFQRSDPSRSNTDFGRRC
jgi:hypothetical protein